MNRFNTKATIGVLAISMALTTVGWCTWSYLPRGPVLKLESPRLDFGKVPAGAITKKALTLRNVGDAPLKILNLRASCGCTSGSAPTSPIPPGATSAIEIAFDSKNKKGRYDGTLTIESDDSATGTALVGLRADVYESARLEPTQLYFDGADVGSSEEKAVRILLTEPTRVETFVDPEIRRGGHFGVEAEVSQVNDREYLVTVRMTPLRVGDFSGQVAFDLRRSGRPPLRVALPFGVHVPGPLTLEPAEHWFRVGDPDARAKDFRVSWSRSTNFSLSSIDFDHGLLDVKSTSSQRSATLVVEPARGKALDSTVDTEIVVHGRLNDRPHDIRLKVTLLVFKFG